MSKNSPTPTTSCEDFLEFQEALKQMRTVDDKIVYELNASLQPGRKELNSSALCEKLYDQLQQSYRQRDSAIQNCINISQVSVKNLTTMREADSDNIDLSKRLRKEQNKLRMFQTELNVEEVVRDRSLKLFYERCRTAYKPPNAKMMADSLV